MRKEKFTNKRMGSEHLQVVHQANNIIRQYQAQGYDLTLRQLYYQFIALDAFPSSWLREINSEKTKAQMVKFLGTAKGGRMTTEEAQAALGRFQWTKNTERNYKNLGNILNDARHAGLIDWHSIVDRTRELNEWAHREDPADAINHALKYYAIDMWEHQPVAVELWVEKEALAGVFRRVCMKWDVPYLSCRGYVSASSAFQAFERIEERWHLWKKPTVILHFGNHDPSGMDMTRDNHDRLDLFTRALDVPGAEVRRLALNWNQVREYSPPPAPAKVTDSRAKEYIAQFCKDSWELDALDPETLTALAEDEFQGLIDPDQWAKDEDRLTTDRETLKAIIANL